jgi:hypothetical protein
MSESESFVNLNQQQQAAPAHGYEVEPFDAADLLRHGVDATKCKWVEVTIPELKGLLLGHVTTESSCSSFKPFIEVSPMSLAQEILGGTDNEPSSRIKLQAGLGIFTLVHRESKLHLVHQRRGPVVGTNCGPALHTSLILFCEEGGQGNADDPAEVITELCEKLMADNATTRTNEFTIRRWNCRELPSHLCTSQTPSQQHHSVSLTACFLPSLIFLSPSLSAPNTPPFNPPSLFLFALLPLLRSPSNLLTVFLPSPPLPSFASTQHTMDTGSSSPASPLGAWTALCSHLRQRTRL